MKIKICFIGIILFPFFLSAQVVSMNLALHRLVKDDVRQNDEVNVLIQGDVTKIQELIIQNSGKVIGIAGSIISARISVSTIAHLLESNFVKCIQSNVHHYQTLNDTMRWHTRVDDVHNGLPPLASSYDGTGVLIGIIDSGIDINHPDFKDSLGNTRVRFLWDMTKPIAVNTPQPYNYGQEWRDNEIDAGLAVSHTGEDQFGHGTFVTGIAAGNGSAVGHFKGVAPLAELIVVAYNFLASDTVPRIAHAVQYIFDKANLLGKPCVINASLGDYYGSHDGTDLESQFVSNLINQQNGRLVVAAAGNVGITNPFHLGRNLTTGDTAFTWFRYNSQIGGAYVQIFADTSQVKTIRFAVGADQVLPNYNFRGRTSFLTSTLVLNNVVTRTLSNNGNRLGVIQFLGTIVNGVYSLEIFVVPDSTTYNWRFITTGTGQYDSWSFDWVYQSLPSIGTYPDMINYRRTDTTQSIVSGIACLDNVITVGNYFNTDRHFDVDSVLQITVTDRPGDLADNSSRGPTRDGRIKPEITAPGHHIISSGVLTLIPGLISVQPYKVAEGGFHITGGGTSASSPVVAGISALYLQMNPLANWQEIKNAITGCARHDIYTWGSIPNNAWGYGKADAFSALTACNFTSVSILLAKEEVTVFPNPANEYVQIHSPAKKIKSVTVHDFTGKKIMSISMSIYTIQLGSLETGIYFFRIHFSDGNEELKRVQVLH